MAGSTLDIAPLREAIKSEQILLPGSEEYVTSIDRWSQACVKEAVSYC